MTVNSDVDAYTKIRHHRKTQKKTTYWKAK